MTLPPEADELYGLALDRFVAERDALAKRLRSAGDRETAARVKALRKPTPGAWALNQVVRRHPTESKALLEATEALRRAQRRLLGGGDRERYRRAGVERAEGVSRLSALAAEILRGAGLGVSRTRVEEIAGTLRAVASDAQAREDFASGRLTSTVRAAGFGDLSAIGPVPEDTGEPSGPDERLGRVEEARAALDRAEREAAEAARSWIRANEDATRSQQLAERAARTAAELAERADADRRRADELGRKAELVRLQADERRGELEALEG